MSCKLLIPALAIGLLAGCVTDYTYRTAAPGDYYYGRPSTEYRQYGPYYGPYDYNPYGYGAYDPYGYRRPYSNPYHHGPYRHHDDRPGHGYPRQYPPSRPRQPGNDRPPPWRDLGRMLPPQPQPQPQPTPGQSDRPLPQRQAPLPEPPRQPQAEPRRRGSPLKQLIDGQRESGEQ